jgi:hypothetical protein
MFSFSSLSTLKSIVRKVCVIPDKKNKSDNSLLLIFVGVLRYFLSLQERVQRYQSEKIANWKDKKTKFGTVKVHIKRSSENII